MIRLFVALRPPAPIRDMLADIMDGVPGARWQDDEQLHLTLRFVGEVERPQAEDLAACLARVHALAPVVAMAGVGAFERRGGVDALWAGVAPAGPLHELNAKVERACVRAGLPPERRAFKPHVTVARLPRSVGVLHEVADWRAKHAGLSSLPFELPHLVLYKSRLGQEGASYEPVARWPLGTAAPAAGSH